MPARGKIGYGKLTARRLPEKAKGLLVDKLGNGMDSRAMLQDFEKPLHSKEESFDRSLPLWVTR